jgi:nitrogen fixation NifU-like protein
MGELPGFDGYARKTEGDCGDTLEIWIKVDQGILSEVNFCTDGCAATVASGSMTTVLAKGKTVAGAQQITQQDVLTALEGLPEGNRHCAQFAVSALKTAIRDYLDLQRDPWKKAYRKY